MKTSSAQPWYTVSQELETHLQKGLTAQEAVERLCLSSAPQRNQSAIENRLFVQK